METTWQLYTLLSLILLYIAYIFSPINGTRRRRRLPPTPGAPMPFIGHFRFLKFPLHRTLHHLSQKLGPIFSLRFGNRLVVVVSSPATAEECFTKNDVVLANRPRLIIGKYIGYNYSTLVASPYGDYWRNLRRFATVEVFSTARLNLFQSIRRDEVGRLIGKLRRNCSDGFARVQLRESLFDLTFNNIMRMIAGKRYFGRDEDTEEAKRFRELKDDIFRVSGISNPQDFIPVLRWFDFRGLKKKMGKLFEQMDGFLQGLIDEHRGNKDANTMISHLLNLRESDPEFYTDTVIKALIVVMILAGTDTSGVTLEWAMSALLNHPDKLDRARAEIDEVVGGDRLIDESDFSRLPYLHHIVSETLRLFPATPLLVPHEPSTDCKIGGYDVPRGTIVLVNAWSIHRDPAVWDEPERFRPERFEGEAGLATPPKLMPFGMGRRSCPGNGLALRVVTLALGALIQCFEWRRVDGEMVDMAEGKGVSTPKAVPLVAMCKAREVALKVGPLSPAVELS
ncbi:cytochrome P450 81Q32-like [Andrographis paniculata]|uniref:cytochrome P450 81Q32-like n=1 Tax=Andrographis paniculata TaxID=175694 RepID=UPI0021E93B8E|nr:cytochrome P450 81Q32-like [Andrographis paniculata]